MENEEALDTSGEFLVCVREGCSNPPVDDEELEGKYCSSECVVDHIKAVFANWVQERKIEPIDMEVL